MIKRILSVVPFLPTVVLITTACNSGGQEILPTEVKVEPATQESVEDQAEEPATTAPDVATSTASDASIETLTYLVKSPISEFTQADIASVLNAGMTDNV